MKIIFVRHGKPFLGRDSIAPSAVKQAGKLGEEIKLQAKRPLVLSSSVTRAKETAREIATKLGVEVQAFDELGVFNSGSPEAVKPGVEIIKQLGEKHDVVVVVTHAPTIEEMVFQFTGELVRSPRYGETKSIQT